MKRGLFRTIQCLVLVAFLSSQVLAAGVQQRAPTSEAIAISFQIVKAKNVAGTLRRAFPHVTIQIDANSNGIIVHGTHADVEAIRAMAPALDIRNPTEPIVEIEVPPGNGYDSGGSGAGSSEDDGVSEE